MSANGMTPQEREAFVREQVAEGARILPEGIARVADMFCGCGEPVKAWEWVLGYLSSLESSHKWKPESGAEYVAAYTLDYCGLTEHGTSIRVPWLTDAGKEALVFLRKHGSGWAEADIWWINSDGMTLARGGSS